MLNVHLNHNHHSRGAFGLVRKCVHNETQKPYAVKIINKDLVTDLAPIRKEISILQQIDHPNVVRLFEVFETDKELQLVMELVTGGELFDRIVEKEKYSEKDASELMKQLLEALLYLHSRDIVHRDLKVWTASCFHSDCTLSPRIYYSQPVKVIPL